MPTYEYRCADCGKTFDIVQSFTDDALTTCPECSGHLKKVFGSVGISFKGSGFYINDSGSKTKAGGSSGSADSSGSSDSGISTTGESSTSDSSAKGSGSSDKKSGSAKSKTKSKAKSKAGSASSSN